jgi:hypothetical protein
MGTREIPSRGGFPAAHARQFVRLKDFGVQEEYRIYALGKVGVRTLSRSL